MRSYKIPGPKGAAVLDVQEAYLSPSISTPMPLVWASAKDCVITDVDGNQYIDFTSGVLVTNTGHCHPKIVKAVQDQAALLLNCYDSAHPLRSQFVEKLASLLPEDLKRVLMLSSGSEAVDAALKIARISSGKHEVIGFENAFHGRTYGGMSAGGMFNTKAGFGPMVSGFLRAPFPDYYRMDGTEEEIDVKCLAALETVLKTQSTGEVGAVITEAYQGGAGSIVATPRFMRGLREFCNRYGILLIFDEVQASFGRTGRMFAFENFGIVPDIVVLGKGISSGLPTAAVVARHSIIEGLKRGSLSSTYGANPLSCAAGIASIQVIQEERLPERADKLGQLFKRRLYEMMERHRFIGDVRGMGLALAVEFVKDKQTKEPHPEFVHLFVHQLLKAGLSVMAPIGRFGNVLRVAPPLTMSEEMADEGLDIIERVLQQN